EEESFISPQVECTPDGGFVVASVRWLPEPPVRYIIRRFDADGEPAGPEIVIDPPAPDRNSIGPVELFAAEDGTLTIGWETTVAPEFRRQFDWRQVLPGGVLGPSSKSPGFPYHPRIAASGPAGHVATVDFQDDRLTYERRGPTMSWYTFKQVAAKGPQTFQSPGIVGLGLPGVYALAYGVDEPEGRAVEIRVIDGTTDLVLSLPRHRGIGTIPRGARRGNHVAFAWRESGVVDDVFEAAVRVVVFER
ncbi:MAG: hypothetical protein H6746_20620, partial [Deltaproteobacteria bacterium]|nr:hypothetical protein [Deltaproteobacteria bacterium]